MNDARRYAVWLDPRSRSRAFHSWKSSHCQKLSPPPFTHIFVQWELATDHRFVNWGTISKLFRPDFWYLAYFWCHVTLKLARSIRCEELTVSHCTGLIFMSAPPNSVTSFIFLFVYPFIQTDLVTTISHERLEQSGWNLWWMFTSPTDNLVRFWRSKVKVTTVRGEGFYFDTGASKSNFCLTVALNVVSVELMRIWWWCCNSEMMLDLFTGFDQYLVGILTQLSRNKSIKRLAIGKNMSGNRPRWTAAVYYWLVCKLSCTFSDLTRFFGS